MILRCVFLIICVAASISLHAKDSWDAVERIVAIGDIHGDYGQMLNVLKMTGVIDSKRRWVGGATHLVQTGDIPDRGPDTAKIIRFLMKLEKQARRRGGYVHLLVGNHEAMNVMGDLRYVHPGEYSALRTPKSRQLRDAYYEASLEWMNKNIAEEDLPVLDEAHRQQWETRYPLGYVEHRRIWSPQGEFGRWITKHNTVIRINDILFVHGGLGPAYSQQELSELNDAVDTALVQPRTQESILESDDSPLWYRGLANNAEEFERPHLEHLLERFAVNHIVMAHTVTEGAIKPRFDGRVILIDVGMSAYYGSHMAALIVEHGKFSVEHRGVHMPLPFSGDALISYLERAMALETQKAALQALIEKLQQKNGAVPVP